ncbi:MAG: hypothetical protein LBT06_10460 [Hungatella sp.]|nr:hypothetical protein [Hungatella sp.]
MMEYLEGKKDNSVDKSMVRGNAYLPVVSRETDCWLETDNNCSQYCRSLGSEEYEFVQINRYMAETVFYTVSHGTICLQDYFMDQIDSILKSYGFQNFNYGTYGICNEPAIDSQLVAEMVFETYAKEFEENRRYVDYESAKKHVKKVIDME